MNGKQLISLTGVMLLLAGCWDEQNFNQTIHVPMAGISGSPSDLEVSFALPAVERKTDESRTIVVKGTSFHEAQLVADATTHNQIDTSMLTALLIEDQAAFTNIYAYLDAFYRDVRNRLGMSLIVTKGPANQFIDKGSEFGDNINTFYAEAVYQLTETSLLPFMDMQIACTYLFDPGIDLQLPYLEMDPESDFPRFIGVALFHDKVFTGESIPIAEMVVMQLMKDQLGKKAIETIQYKDAALSYEIEKLDRSVKTFPEKVKLKYSLEVSVLDYFPDRVAKSAHRKEIESAIEEDLMKRSDELIKKMKSVSHDGLGLGRYYRAFQPEVFDEKKWAEKYRSLSVEVDIEVTVRDSGIMD